MRQLNNVQKETIVSFLTAIKNNKFLHDQVKLEAFLTIQKVSSAESTNDFNAIEEDLIDLVCDERRMLPIEIRLQAIHVLKLFYHINSDLDLITKAFKTTY